MVNESFTESPPPLPATPPSDATAARSAAPRWAGTGTDSAALAQALVETWQRIEIALAPIIGHRGVTALHLRSRQVAARQHPWLQVAPGVGHDATDLAALRDVVAQQDAATAHAAGDTLLLNFQELLTRLVGASLTERLLRPVWLPDRDASSSKEQTP